MMDDLISRRAAIECLKTKIAEMFFKETAEKNVEKWLNELPTVQPEQKTGRWIDYCGDLHCSVCGFRNSDHYCLGEGIACPNCGAFMPDGLKNVLG